MLPLQLPQHAHQCADTHTHTHTHTRCHVLIQGWISTILIQHGGSVDPLPRVLFMATIPWRQLPGQRRYPLNAAQRSWGHLSPLRTEGPGHWGFDLLTQVGCAFMVLAREASFSSLLISSLLTLRDECSGLLSPSTPLRISTHNDEHFFQGCLWDGSGETEPSGVSSMDDKSTAHSVSREILLDAAWKYPSVTLTVRDRLYADMLNQGRRGPSEAALTFPISVTLQTQQIMRLKCLYWKVLTF